MPKLWELTDELTALLKKIEDNDDELNEELEQTLDGLHMDLDSKLTNVGRFILSIEGELDKAEEWYRRFRAVRKTYQNTLERVERYMYHEMLKIRWTQFSDPAGLGVWKPTLTRGETVVKDYAKMMAAVPEEYYDMVCKPHLSEIRKLIDEGLLDPEEGGIEIERKPSMRFYKTRNLKSKKQEPEDGSEESVRGVA